MEIGKFFHSNYVMGTENMEILKVVIADDEVRICQLIQALIDWDSLGLKVVGIATTERMPAKWYSRHSRTF